MPVQPHARSHPGWQKYHPVCGHRFPDRLAEELQTLSGGELFCAGTAAVLLGQPAPALSAEELDGLPWVVARGWLAIASTGSVVIREVEVPTRLQLVLPENLIGLRDRALLLIGFAGAFRRSELVGLNVGDLDFRKAGLVITLRRSKTDQTSV